MGGMRWLIVMVLVGSMVIGQSWGTTWDGWSLRGFLHRTVTESTEGKGSGLACDGDRWYFNPRCVYKRTFETCPLRDNFEKTLSSHLRASLVGQEAALDMLSSAVVNRQPGKPTIIHISGENGVGKTLAAKEVCKNRFLLQTDGGMPEGMLYIRGSLYKYDGSGIIRLQHALEYEQKVSELRNDIFVQIAEQLKKCPQSVIVFDEYTVPNKDVMPVMEQFMDGQPVRWDGREVLTYEATFLFVSDFGSEGFTYGMSQREMEECIDIDMKRTWGSTLFHTQHLTTLVIPFQPMQLPRDFSPEVIAALEAPEPVIQLVKRLVRDLPLSLQLYAGLEVKVGLAKSHTKSLAGYLYRYQVASEMYRFRNYRGISQLFLTKVANPFRREFDLFLLKHKKRTFALVEAIASVTVPQSLEEELDLSFSFVAHHKKSTQDL